MKMMTVGQAKDQIKDQSKVETESPVSNRLQEPVFEHERPVLASTKLRHMLADSDRLIVCPGVYDGLSARIALDVGFDAMYMVCNAFNRAKTRS